MYGRKTLTEMHEILTVNKVDYIILEDSICMAASTGCSTKDLVDAANGDTPEYAMSKSEIWLSIDVIMNVNYKRHIGTPFERLQFIFD